MKRTRKSRKNATTVDIDLTGLEQKAKMLLGMGKRAASSAFQTLVRKAGESFDANGLFDQALQSRINHLKKAGYTEAEARMMVLEKVGERLNQKAK